MYISRNNYIEYDKGSNLEHKLISEIKRLCDRIIELSKGNLYYGGSQKKDLGDFHEFVYRGTKFFVSFNIDIWDIRIEVVTTKQDIELGQRYELGLIVDQICKKAECKQKLIRIARALELDAKKASS